jgi:hypothetical protein
MKHIFVSDTGFPEVLQFSKQIKEWEQTRQNS